MSCWKSKSNYTFNFNAISLSAFYKSVEKNRYSEPIDQIKNIQQPCGVAYLGRFHETFFVYHEVD